MVLPAGCGEIPLPPTFNRLLKNAHLLRCAASLVNRHTSMYASFLSFCAPYIWTFLNSLFKIEFFNKQLRFMARMNCRMERPKLRGAYRCWFIVRLSATISPLKDTATLPRRTKDFFAIPAGATQPADKGIRFRNIATMRGKVNRWGVTPLSRQPMKGGTSFI